MGEENKFLKFVAFLREIIFIMVPLLITEVGISIYAIYLRKLRNIEIMRYCYENAAESPIINTHIIEVIHFHNLEFI